MALKTNLQKLKHLMDYLLKKKNRGPIDLFDIFILNYATLNLLLQPIHFGLGLKQTFLNTKT